MNKEQGPIRMNVERLAAARTPPIAKPGLPAEVLRKYRNNDPIRRPAVKRRQRTEEALQVPTTLVDQGLDAVRKGETTDVLPEGGRFTVRILPAVLDVVRQSWSQPGSNEPFHWSFGQIVRKRRGDHETSPDRWYAGLAPTQNRHWHAGVGDGVSIRAYIVCPKPPRSSCWPASSSAFAPLESLRATGPETKQERNSGIEKHSWTPVSERRSSGRVGLLFGIT